MAATIVASPNANGGVRPQPPLVDSTSCYCGADIGLKAVVGARKFVPRASLCIQPDINPNGQPKSRSSHNESSKTHEPLLPGLPDDLAIACLIRVPRVEHQKLRLVSKQWNQLISGSYFYSLRKKHEKIEEWVYVIRRDREGKVSCHSFDPVHQVWQPLPPVPVEYSGAIGFGSAILNGCYLYLFGGIHPVKGSMRCVVFYNACTNKWHRAPSMLRKRHFFGSCVIDNHRLYVAGGEGMDRTLRSSEVYDPNKNKWTFIADMATGMIPFIGVVHDEKWFLKGLDSYRQVICEVYTPKTNRWSVVNGEIVSRWRNPSTSFNGRLYASDCRDGCKLRVYDGASDSWKKFIDGTVHLGSSRSLEAAALVPLNGKLCIVRNNMSISLVDVVNPGKSFEISSAQVWENFAAKQMKLKSFVTSLWLSIAGRTGFKSHIVHCQVLQA